MRHADLRGLRDDRRFGLGAVGQLGGVDDGPVKAAGTESFLTGGLVFDLGTMTMPVRSLLAALSWSRATAKVDNMTMRWGP